MATEPPIIDPQVLRRASNVLVMLTDLSDPSAAAEIIQVWTDRGHTWGEFAAEGAAGLALTNLQAIIEQSIDHPHAAARRAQAALALGVVLASDHARQAVTA